MAHAEYVSVQQSEDPEAQRSSPRAQQTRAGSWTRKRLVLSFAAAFLVLQAFIWIPFWRHHRHEHTHPALSLEELRNGTYSQRIQPIDWLAGGVDGQYVKRTGKGFAIAHWNQSDEQVVAPLDFKDDAGTTHRVASLELNSDRTHALLKTDPQKHWRHSSFARFWLIEVASGNIVPLRGERLSLAGWSPDGRHIAYVFAQDIYVYSLSSKSTRQVTRDGSEDVFNGIPDWVYEEEVFSGEKALWWSPNGSHLAYMRTNDSMVPKFPIPYFLRDQKSHGEAYPELVKLKYPKPGYPNPLVQLWLYSTAEDEARPINLHTELVDPIFGEVFWVGSKVMVKVMDRESDALETWAIDAHTRKALRSRHYTSKELGGSWFEITHNSHAINGGGYVDTVDNEGYNHLGYFPSAAASDPILLTRGQWEVQDAAIAVNEKTRHVYFHAAKRSPTEISLYRVSLDHPEQEPEEVAQWGKGVYIASFSPDASFATVIHRPVQEPLVQAVVELNESAGNSSAQGGSTSIIEKNEGLRKLLADRKLLETDYVVYGTKDLGSGVTVNYREIRPSSFNPKKKHPLLFFNYGGPGSQQVLQQLSLDFQRIYAEAHNAVVVTVDPRGTANMGRKYRASVRDHLGENEADDVIAVAKIWNELPYIDSETTAIWGWSYGGFLTLKTLERDVDLAFKYGVAVAPVTDWALYDSIYTERYMHKPANNARGYEVAGVRNVTNIGRHDRLLIMHGTGDDNVHFQNTLRLLDNFNLAGVENYDVHVFPDSDHSIAFHNANSVVYDKIDSWLSEHQQQRTS